MKAGGSVDQIDDKMVEINTLMANADCMAEGSVRRFLKEAKSLDLDALERAAESGDKEAAGVIRELKARLTNIYNTLKRSIEDPSRAIAGAIRNLVRAARELLGQAKDIAMDAPPEQVGGNPEVGGNSGSTNGDSNTTTSATAGQTIEELLFDLLGAIKNKEESLKNKLKELKEKQVGKTNPKPAGETTEGTSTAQGMDLSDHDLQEFRMQQSSYERMVSLFSSIFQSVDQTKKDLIRRLGTNG